MTTMQDFLSGAPSTPDGLMFQDGVEEILDTEGLFDDIGHVLDPAGIFRTDGGGLINSITGGGKPPQPGQQGGGGPGGILGAITGGVGQALGLGGANNPLASLFGAGIGGVLPGTGPLPGSLGQAAQGLFGQPGIPPAGQALQQAAPVDYAQIAGHTEKAGRAIVRRILGGMNPPLNQIRQLLAQRRNQIQATAEHRQLNAAADAHREVTGYLGSLLDARANGRGYWKA